MRLPRFVLWFLLVAAIDAPLTAQLRWIGPDLDYRPELRVRVGDDPRWADPSFDDSDWLRLEDWQRGLPSRTGPFWVRIHYPHTPMLASGRRDAVQVSVVAAFEFHWNGRLLGRNGTVGATRQSEVAGSIDWLQQLPPGARGPGPHVAALRMSSWRSGFPTDVFGLNIMLGDYREMLTRRAQRPVFSVLAVGGAFAMGIAAGLLWLLADHRMVTLLFAGLGFTAATMQALQAWRWLYDYPYSWHFPRLLGITLVVAILGLLLVAFVQTFFDLPYKRWRLGIAAALMAGAWWLSDIYHVKSIGMSWAAFFVSMQGAAAAVRAGRQGARFVLGGLMVGAFGLLLSPREFLEQSFYLNFGTALLGCLTALLLQWREERRLAREARLTSARLELELLRKSLQPHFLMNTLTSLCELIEQSPSQAVRQIEALAGEFRLLSRVAGERLIPLAQELDLCDCHLQIMSLRQGLQWTLERDISDADLLVPPALLHTLIENGITHSRGRAADPRFRALVRTEGSQVRLALTAPSPQPPGDVLQDVRLPAKRAALPPPTAEETAGDAGSSGARRSATPPAGSGGTGLRYIQARLEESFPGRWNLQAGPTEDGRWQTLITFPLERNKPCV